MANLSLKDLALKHGTFKDGEFSFTEEELKYLVDELLPSLNKDFLKNEALKFASLRPFNGPTLTINSAVKFAKALRRKVL